MSFDTTDLVRLAIRLDRAADVSEAKAKDHELHGEQPQAKQEKERAESGRRFANVCREAVDEIKSLRSRLEDKRARQAKKVNVGDVGGPFEAFWKAYPNKKAKGDAKRAWLTMKCEPVADKIMEGLARAVVSLDWTKEAGKYIPHPATWLRREGWEDDYGGPVTQVRKSDDPPKWREFLSTHDRPYEPFRFALEHTKTDYRSWMNKR